MYFLELKFKKTKLRKNPGVFVICASDTKDLSIDTFDTKSRRLDYVSLSKALFYFKCFGNNRTWMWPENRKNKAIYKNHYNWIDRLFRIYFRKLFSKHPLDFGKIFIFNRVRELIGLQTDTYLCRVAQFTRRDMNKLTNEILQDYAHSATKLSKLELWVLDIRKNTYILF